MSPAPAEWWERLVARIIDGVPFVVLYYILFAAFLALFEPEGPMHDPSGGRPLLPGLLAWLISGVAFAVYDVLLHSRAGSTLGKSLARIRLVALPGGVLTTAALVKRAALMPGLMALTGIPVANLVGGILVFAVGLSILIDKPLQQGLHDRLAGTTVVRARR